MKKYLSLVLFAHSVFALPFAMVGFVLGFTYGGGTISIVKLLLVIACMVTARNSAMAFNRYIDRGIDARNPRTKDRDIPAGRIKPGNALAFVVINCVLFCVFAGLLNTTCLYLAPVALFVVLFYSYTKRFTSLCHFILGMGLGLAPVGAYAAVTGKLAWLPVIIGTAVMLWTAGFDIIYALQDEGFDKDNHLFSIPSWLGTRKALILSTCVHILCGVLIISTLRYSIFGFVYCFGLLVFCGMLVYQHLLVKPDDLSKVGRAFQTANGYASMAFALCFLADAAIIHWHVLPALHF